MVEYGWNMRKTKKKELIAHAKYFERWKKHDEIDLVYGGWEVPEYLQALLSKELAIYFAIDLR